MGSPEASEVTDTCSIFPPAPSQCHGADENHAVNIIVWKSWPVHYRTSSVAGRSMHRGGRAGRTEDRLNRTESRFTGAVLRDFQQKHWMARMVHCGAGLELEGPSAAQRPCQAAVSFLHFLASHRWQGRGTSNKY